MEDRYYNLEAEAAVLGSMILEPKCIEQYLLTADDFWNPAHKIIFTALQQVFESGMTDTDLVILRDHLKNTGKMKEAGGVNYLIELANATPTAANFKYYSKIVKTKSQMREFDQNWGKIQEKIKEATTPAEIATAIEGLSSIVTVPDSGVSRLGDHLEAAYDSMYDTTDRITTGFPNIDQIVVGFEAGDIIILAARPSIGKTSLAISMATNMIRANNPVLFFSFEMTKPQIAERIICAEAKISAQKAKLGELDDEEKKIMLDTIQGLHVDKLPFYFTEYGANSPSYVRVKIRSSKKSHNIKCVFIDYLQMMHKGTKEQNRNYELGWILDYLKTTAKKCDVPIVVLCQLNRASEGRADRGPRVSDLRDSGEIEQTADVVMLLHRPSYSDPKADDTTDVIIPKQRRGPTGTAKILFVPETASFVSLGYE